MIASSAPASTVPVTSSSSSTVSNLSDPDPDPIATSLQTLLLATTSLPLLSTYNHYLSAQSAVAIPEAYSYVAADLRGLSDVTDYLVLTGESLRKASFLAHRNVTKPSAGCMLRYLRPEEPGVAPPVFKRAKKGKATGSKRQAYDDLMEKVAVTLTQQCPDVFSAKGGSGKKKKMAHSVKQQALQALLEEEKKSANERAIIAAAKPIDYVAARKNKLAEANYLHNERLLAIERIKLQNEVDELEAARAVSADGKTYGTIDDTVFFDKKTFIIDKTAEVAVIASEIYEQVVTAEFDSGAGYKYNPFRIEITRENCTQMGLSDYFDKVVHAMSLPQIHAKIQQCVYFDIKSLMDDFVMMVRNAMQYNGNSWLPAKELGNMVNGINKKYRKPRHPLYDKTKFVE
jgi:hypothetical protein